MNKIDCQFERASHIGVAIALLLIAIGFTVIGISLLPVIGLVFAIPVYIASFFFLTARRSRECMR
jgi:hypothetical protein